jgi:hypothetical protein
MLFIAGVFLLFSPDVKRGQNEWKKGKKVVLKCAIPVVLLKHVIKRIQFISAQL